MLPTHCVLPQDGKTLEDELEVVEGMKFDRGYISPYFVTDPKTMKADFEDALILIHEKKISGYAETSCSTSTCCDNPDDTLPANSIASLIPILEQVIKTQRPLLIIAEDVESEALATLIINKLRAGMKLVAVKAPGFGENRKANLADIACLTGGQVISEELGHKLDKVDLSMLGQAKKVTITKDDTIILHGAGTKDELQARVDQIQDAIAQATSDYDRYASA